MNKYIALTIGPVVKTLTTARKTRELWGASYMFSYLMREILEQVNKFENTQIILPSADLLNQNNYLYGAGLYPDRLIIGIPNNNDTDYFAKLITVIDKVQEDFFSKIKNTFESRFKDLTNKQGELTDLEKEEKPKLQNIIYERDKIEEYLRNYFRFYFIEKEIDKITDEEKKGKNKEELKEIEKKENPIFVLNKYLDSLELQESFISKELKNTNLITDFLYSINGSFLFRDAFRYKDAENKKRFDSIFEISAREFLKKKDIKILFDKYLDKGDKVIQDEILKFLKKKYEDDFKTAHKYIAIIQADGDAVGDAIADIYRKEKNEGLQIFSKDLLDFAKKATEKIHDYGGAPIYAGGDDLLFFAPIRNGIYTKEIDEKKVKKTNHIFKLLDDLDEAFKEKFPNASLSFGLSISYYKFPMQEAFVEAYELMKNKAKEFEIFLKNKEGITVKNKKNATAFKVLKHSGQYFGTVLNKNSVTYKKFKDLVESNIDDDNFLNSIPQKILANEEIIKSIGNNEEKVKNYIDNNFNETIHKTEPYKSFLENFRELILAAFEEYEIKKINDEQLEDNKAINVTYSTLRMVKFLNRNDNE